MGEYLANHAREGLITHVPSTAHPFIATIVQSLAAKKRRKTRSAAKESREVVSVRGFRIALACSPACMTKKEDCCPTRWRRV
jgi:hypothetical protein